MSIPTTLPLTPEQEEVLVALEGFAVPSGYNLCEEITVDLSGLPESAFDTLRRAIVLGVDANHWLHRTVVYESTPRSVLHDPQWALWHDKGPFTANFLDSLFTSILEHRFDVFGTDSLTRGCLVSQDDGTVVWRQSYHHLAIDGAGIHDLVQTVSGIFGELLAGRDPAPLLRKYRRGLAVGVKATTPPMSDASRRFWTERSRHWSGPLQCSPSDGSGVADPRRPWRVQALIPDDLRDRLATCAEACSTSANRLIVVAAATTLAHLSGRTEASFGFVVGGESGRATTANILPISLDLGSTRSVSDILRQLSAELRAVRGAQPSRYEDIVRLYGPRAEAVRGFGPLVNLYAFDYGDLFEGKVVSVRNLATGPIVDLSISMHDRGVPGDTTLVVEASAERYDERQAREVAELCLEYLQGLSSTAPTETVGRCQNPFEPVGPEADEVSPGHDVERDMISVAVMVRRWAAVQPHAIAVVGDSGSLSYEELNARARSWAEVLRSRGLRPGDRVGLRSVRDVELLPLLLGVSLAGCVQVPIDVETPREQESLRLAVAGASALVSYRGKHGPDASAAMDATTVEALEEAAAIEGMGPEVQYLLFTSGSSGTPKGVAVTHDSVMRYLADASRRYQGLSMSSVMHSAVAFDLSVTALYGPLLTGGTVHLVNSLDVLDEVPGAFVKLTPSQLPLLLAIPDLEGLVSVVLGGEALTGGHLAALWAKAPGVRVFNEYGPTETTVGCIVEEIQPGTDGVAPIGRPMDGVVVALVNGWGRPQRPGFAGEVIVSGPGVARGYVTAPDGTSCLAPFPRNFEVFRHAAAYATGDLAVQDPDSGIFTYLGRRDDQRKVGGHRVELGAFRDVATRIGWVSFAEAAIEGERVHLFYGTSVDAPDDAEDVLRRAFEESFPLALQPVIHQVDTLPRTTNGKVDTARLVQFVQGGGSVAPSRARPQASPPSMSTDRVTALLGEILGAPDLRENDDFGDWGGSSVHAARAAFQLSEAFGVRVRMRDVISLRTGARLAALVDEALPGAPGSTEPIPDSGSSDAPPRFAACQTGIAYEYLMDPQSTAYHLARRITLGAPLPVARLREALARVMASHAALRARLALDPRGGVIPIEESEPVIVVQSGDELLLPFDIRQDPPLRMHLDCEGTDCRELTLVAHHLFVDGAALVEIAHQLVRAAEDPSYVPPASDCHDFARWLEGHRLPLDDEDNYLRTLRSLGPSRRRIQGPDGSTRGPAVRSSGRLAKAGEVTAQLTLAEVAAAVRLAMEDGLGWGSDAPLVVGVPSDLRLRAKDQRLVGNCVNVVNVVVPPVVGATREWIADVRDRVDAALEHSPVMYADVRTEVGVLTGEVFDVCVSVSPPAKEDAGRWVPVGAAKFPLSVELPDGARPGGEVVLEAAASVLDGALDMLRDHLIARLDTLLRGGG